MQASLCHNLLPNSTKYVPRPAAQSSQKLPYGIIDYQRESESDSKRVRWGRDWISARTVTQSTALLE